MMTSYALLCAIALGAAAASAAETGSRKILQSKDPNGGTTVTVSATSPRVDAIAITPALPYPQTGIYCNVTGDSRIPAAGAFFPLTVRVPVGVQALVVFANVTGPIPGTGCSSVVQQPGTTVVQQPGTSVVQQPGTSVVQQPGTSVVQQPGTSVVQQPGTTVVQQPNTTRTTPGVVQPGTTASCTPSVVQPTTVVQQPTSVVQQPTSVVQQPTTVVQQPTSPAPVVKQPTPPTPVVQQPAPPTPVVQQPSPPAPVVKQPSPPTPTVVQQPTTPTVVQQPTTPTVVQQPSTPTVVQQPPTPTVVQQPPTPTVVQQPPATVVQQTGKKLLQTPAPVEFISNNGSMGQPQLVVTDTTEGVTSINFKPTTAGQTAVFNGALQVAVTTTNDGFGSPYIPYRVDSRLSPNCGLTVKFVAI